MQQDASLKAEYKKSLQRNEEWSPKQRMMPQSTFTKNWTWRKDRQTYIKSQKQEKVGKKKSVNNQTQRWNNTDGGTAYSG